ncbi:probable 39S ribosomal protein L45, mitochondrial [Galendromus occidentalis]|uniref:Large ribosomal subunit protein mL45 n=1 Tax=Galendromus occidentalis TaxID=34638 RepID=A0AAJ6QVM5_9ACAR|nr:probable 39S ribosomal protein L45, mitochondrial [Galendromus occidentalis]
MFGGAMNNRHRDPKWKKHRANKVFKVKLPDFEKFRDVADGKIARNEVRREMKKRGIAPCRKWDEKPIFFSTLTGVIEPYVPPEGDGKASLLSKSGALQKMEQLQKKSVFTWHLRKLKQFETDFSIADFASEANDLYIKAHEALAEQDQDKLFSLVTEAAYPEMMANVEHKTLRWQMLGSLEPARVVHIRTQSLLTNDNTFAQVTVRLHTQQTLAVYDRFGRLLHGSEVLVKDVLEYVVFEKHIANLYGQWRLHAKIIPDWKASKEPSKRTFVEPEVEAPEETSESTETTTPGAEEPKAAQGEART